MRLWLSKSSEVPLREQLVTQIILGIASNDLAAGERLPSTRELARRYKIHSNTVSAAYRELARLGWAQFKRGSGVYVKARTPSRDGSVAEDLDDLIARFYKATREKGYSFAEVQAGLRRWSVAQPPDHFLIIEPDVELRRILIAEIETATGRSVVVGESDRLHDSDSLIGAVVVAMRARAGEISDLLPSSIEVISITTQSVPESMRGQKLPPANALIAVVSRWAGFLKRARAVLVAAGLDPEALSFRDAREPRWEKGLVSSSMVIADSLIARNLPEGCKARVFRIISDASIRQLRQCAATFVSG
jgi:GntR family transcriptional regulator